MKNEDEFDHTKPLFIPEGQDDLTKIQFLQQINMIINENF